MGRAAEPATQAADSPLLDQYPDAYAAYSLRKLRSDYSGPAIRVRRGSDGTEEDFGFAAGGKLDVSAIEDWLGGADGYVTTWYSQLQGKPDLVQTTADRQPRIAEDGAVFADSDGRMAIKFDRARNTYLTLENGLSSSVPIHESLIYGVGEKLGVEGTQEIINVAAPGTYGHNSFSFRRFKEGGFTERDGVSGQAWPGLQNPGFWAFNYGDGTEKIFSNNAVVSSQSLNGTVSRSQLTLGVNTKSQGDGYDGYLTEVVILPGQPTESGVHAVYDNVNAAWDLGPTGYNPEALMPQKKEWQITLYDWLETISVEDVTLPDETMEWSGALSDKAKMTELFLQVESASASRVVNSAPEWYVLDAGNGKGIEATGKVRVFHTPGGGQSRSWSNEPAYLYQLSIPKQDGTEGNEYKGNPALGRRALVVGMVDMMMYMTGGNYTDWTDMHGKALLGWAETYRWTKDLLPEEVKAAYEQGMERSLDLIINKGARAVNTNMDMFPMHAAGEIYAAAESQAVKDKAVKAVKRTLLGSVNADQVGGPNHEVYAAGDNNGVFAPAGYIMEGDQPEVFYNGESYYHLVGAYSAVMDPTTGEVPGEWTFLEEVLKRMSDWKAYQTFYDPGKNSGQGGLSDKNMYTAGAGFSGRTGAGEPANQASEIWRDITAASLFPQARYLSWNLGGGGPETGASKLPAQWKMENKITSKLNNLTSSLNSVNEGQPSEWGGWSPWTKQLAYLPQDGWYSNLKSLQDNKDPSTYIPVERSGTYNKTFGGPPTGKEFWAYKGKSGSSDQWAFFLEADARQGHYGGWYGGKVETFWTKDTGIVLMNRHGKTGCGDSNEDSLCWDNLDSKAGHHVWGRDENGDGFTTLLLRGRDLNRTSTFNTDGSDPTVTVKNIFNDPSQEEGEAGESGEQSGDEIEGEFAVENTFTTQADGLKVTHTLTSNQSDQVKELWATLPVFLKAHRQGSWGKQMGYDKTSIEYWDGSSWQAMPGDTSGDEVPEMISTTALRLGRNFELGNGIQYAYVDFASPQSLRLAKNIYSDPYQTRQMFRSVHIDLHGDPGTTKSLPAEKSVSYTLQTTDPTTEGDASTSQVIPLQKGWNIVSTSISPTAPAMDSVFAGLQSEITVVENEARERYRPAENINEIGRWNSEEAYRVHAKSDVILAIQGDSLGSPSIALEQGWNLVPYFPSSPLSVEEAVSSIAEDLGPVKDEAGRVYLPEEDPDVLERMEPGEGYRIYVRESTTLTYPGGSN